MSSKNSTKLNDYIVKIHVNSDGKTNEAYVPEFQFRPQDNTLNSSIESKIDDDLQKDLEQKNIKSIDSNQTESPNQTTLIFDELLNENKKAKNKQINLNTKKNDLVLSWENITVYKKIKKSFFSCCSPSNNVKDEDKFFFNSKNDPITYRNSTQSQNSKNSYDIVSSMENQSIESISSISSSTTTRKNGQVLSNVNGLIHAGESLAIMGASGAGKSTLLNVLNFRNLKNFSVHARIKLNGRLINADELANRSAYIQQEDLFIGTLTVKEHLTFLAMLKMGAKYTREEKYRRVNEILKEFNLEKCKDTKIGGNNNKKGISGGEKRRLSFASEILTDPQILFCDEPTSGLDSHMALTIVNTLANLANKGKIIICTIHQPSSQVFDKFNKLCLLAEGQVAYFGDRENAYDFFKSISYECPLKYNPADYYIEILALKKNNVSNISNIQSICDSYEKSSYHQNTCQEINEIDDKYKKLGKPYFNKFNNVGKRYKSSYFTQFMWLFWRQLLNTIREPLATRILIVQSIIIGFFLGFTYFRLGFDQNGIQNKNGLLFITLMQSCLSYLFGAASQYHSQWSVTYRDVKNRVYSVVIYFLAKVLSEVPQNIIFPSLTITIIYWLAYIHPDVTVYLTITSLMVVAANTAVGFGTFLAVTTPNLDATMGLIGPTFFPMLIFSGFLINSSSIPVYFVWIKYISWVYYTNEAVMITLWKNVNEINCPLPSNSTFNNCIKNGYEVLRQLSMDEKNFNLDIGMLFVMVVFWPTLSGVIIYLKSKR